MAIVQSLRKFVDDSIRTRGYWRHPGLTIVLWLLHDANELSPDDLHKRPCYVPMQMSGAKWSGYWLSIKTGGILNTSWIKN